MNPVAAWGIYALGSVMCMFAIIAARSQTKVNKKQNESAETLIAASNAVRRGAEFLTEWAEARPRIVYPVDVPNELVEIFDAGYCSCRCYNSVADSVDCCYRAGLAAVLNFLAVTDASETSD